VFKFTVARLCFSLKTAFAFGFGPWWVPHWPWPFVFAGLDENEAIAVGVSGLPAVCGKATRSGGMDAAASRQDDALPSF